MNPGLERRLSATHTSVLIHTMKFRITFFFIYVFFLFVHYILSISYCCYANTYIIIFAQRLQ